jgi:hypothetical protein
VTNRLQDGCRERALQLRFEAGAPGNRIGQAEQASQVGHIDLPGPQAQIL